jgi:hypothetical protein
MEGSRDLSRLLYAAPGKTAHIPSLAYTFCEASARLHSIQRPVRCFKDRATPCAWLLMFWRGAHISSPSESFGEKEDGCVIGEDEGWRAFTRGEKIAGHMHALKVCFSTVCLALPFLPSLWSLSHSMRRSCVPFRNNSTPYGSFQGVLERSTHDLIPHTFWKIKKGWV